METAPFRLEDFTRVQWAPGARSVWEPRFRAVSNAQQDIEIQLVAMGFKPGALLVVPSENMMDISKLAHHYGLVALILAQQGRSAQSYAATTQEFVQGGPFDYRVAICKASVTDVWFNAWESHDDETIGVLLGYPECCRKFFQATWVAKGLIDTTWEQALSTAADRDANTLTVDPEPACNVTLRHLGLRWVSHLPCSFNCQATKAYVAEISKLIRTNYPNEYITLTEALQWPVQWTALHGIAEIVTPVCRIISRTDATYTKNTIIQHGSLYPNEGARGIEFPFRSDATKIKLVTKDVWTLNGFGSYESMVNGHNTVIAAAGDMRGKSIIDLGCGNGELLRVYSGLASELHGVDIKQDALAKAKKYLNVRELNVYDPEVFNRKFDVAFISVHRFYEGREMTELSKALLERLKAYTKETVFYSYAFAEGWKIIGEEPTIALGNCSAKKVVW